MENGGTGQVNREPHGSVGAEAGHQAISTQREIQASVCEVRDDAVAGGTAAPLAGRHQPAVFSVLSLLLQLTGGGKGIAEGEKGWATVFSSGKECRKNKVFFLFFRSLKNRSSQNNLALIPL
ncbi:hypothetical protein Dimus_024918 [Dionaea muscipula]